MTKNWLHIACAAWLLSSVPAGAGQAFFTTLADIPLMPGLTETAGGATQFDKPEGRIVETEAAAQDARIMPKDILAFYASTLPQLGWTEKSPQLFVRDHEALTLKTTQKQGFSTLTLLVAPD